MKKTKLGLLFLILFLTSCNTSNEPRIINAGPEEHEKKALHFLTTLDGTEAETFTTIINEYQENQSEFQVMFEGYNMMGGANSKTLADLIDDRIRNNRANDMVTMDVANVFDYASQGKLMDLSDTEAAKKLSEYARKDSLVNGKVMSLPLSMTSYSIWVNVNALEDCNLKVPSNWEEFLTCCKILKEHGYEPIAATKNFPKMFILAAMGDLYMDANTESIIERINRGEINISQYAKTGLEHLSILIDEGYLDAKKALQYMPPDTKTLFKNQEGVFAIGTSKEYDPDELEFDVTMMGVPGSDELVTLLASDRRIVVMEDSEYKEECANFLSYFTHPTVQASVATRFGSIPAYINDTGIEVQVDPRMDQIYENINAGRMMLIQDYNLKFEQWRNLNDVANAMLEGSSVEQQMEVLDQLQTEAIPSSD